MDQHPACKPLWIFIKHLSVISGIFLSKYYFLYYVTEWYVRKANCVRVYVCVCVWCVYTHTYGHVLSSHLCSTGIFPVVFYSLPQTQFCLATITVGTLQSLGLGFLCLKAMKNGSRIHCMKAKQAHSREFKIWKSIITIILLTSPKSSSVTGLYVQTCVWTCTYTSHILQDSFLNMQHMYLSFF